MNERIKQIRSQHGLTQKEFGESLGVSRDTIANFESGRAEPKDTFVKLLCSTYKINEAWLRTGAGQLNNTSNDDAKIAAFVGSIMHEESGFKKRFISMLSKLQPSEWAVLEKIARDLLEESEKA